jgi:SAM-dependent methyltransferase
MRFKKVNVDSLRSYYRPASISFFRAVELQTLNQLCCNLDLDNDSLDVGCGDGYIAKELFDSGFRYGIDNDEANDVQLGIKSGFYKKVFVGSAENLPIDNQSLGFVFSNCVLEHIPPIEVVVSEIGRCLKPGGRFIFTVPSDRFGDYLFVATILRLVGLNVIANQYIKFRNSMLNHFNCDSQDQWAERLSRHGMKIEFCAHYMSVDALSLWDKVAILMFLGKLIGLDLSGVLMKRYGARMDNLISKASNEFPSSGGACIAIVAQKL